MAAKKTVYTTKEILMTISNSRVSAKIAPSMQVTIMETHTASSPMQSRATGSSSVGSTEMPASTRNTGKSIVHTPRT